MCRQVYRYRFEQGVPTKGFGMPAELSSPQLAACRSVAARQPWGHACTHDLALCGCLSVCAQAIPSCKAVDFCMVRASWCSDSWLKPRLIEALGLTLSLHFGRCRVWRTRRGAPPAAATKSTHRTPLRCHDCRCAPQYADYPAPSSCCWAPPNWHMRRRASTSATCLGGKLVVTRPQPLAWSACLSRCAAPVRV